MRKFAYKILLPIVRAGLFFYHPGFRVIGRENVPCNGRLVICANHSGLADPIWIVHALHLGHIPRIMAKKEALEMPILGRIFERIGVFGVDREGIDVTAIKKGLKCLKDEEELLIFPEGTRVRNGKIVEPKRGAVMLAARTDSPILPVYLTAQRRPFSKMKCVIGMPYTMEFSGPKPTEAELEHETRRMMERIYKLGEVE